jgi:predicted nuclease of predicted toxin-antitoxin system
VRLKLDENIGRRGAELLGSAGHDVMTVRDQHLQGASDDRVFAVASAEGRALITLDRDFGQVLRFPPASSAGIVILDLGPRPGPQALLERLRDFLAVVETRPLTGRLWIIEPGRVRIHLDRDEG